MVWVTAVALLLSGCVGPFVPVIDIDQTSAQQLRQEVHVFDAGTVPSNATYLGPLKATSCMNKMWDKPASNEDATTQLLYKSRQFGGNAIANLLCEGTEGTNLAKNCWNSVTCHAVALKVPEGGAPTTEVDRKAAPKSGTGFLVSSQGHILTNQHVIDGCKTITTRLPDGTSNSAQVVAVDELNDLAVVLTEARVKAVASFVDGSVYRQGDQVVVYGFPLAGALSSTGNLTTGTVSAMSGLGNDSRYLQISAPIQPGNSGGPVTDMRGNVVGVVTAKLDAIRVAKLTGDLPQNVNFAIKDVVAKSFLQAHNILYRESKRGLPLSTADVTEVVRSYVVYLRCSENE